MKFLSVLIFVGDSKLKTPMPDNVLTRGPLPWIKRHTTRKLDGATRLRAIDQLGELERTTNRKSAA